MPSLIEYLAMKLFILSLIFLSFNSWADKWELVSHKEGIEIYSRSSKESVIKSLKALGVVDAPIGQVTAILRNVESASKWIPSLSERSYVENISDVEAILYDVNKMPWPVNDRELVVHHKLSLSTNKKYLVLKFKSVEHPKKKVQKDRVRAKFHHGSIKFIPMGEKTKIELQLLVDPMGSIPKWLVNILQISMPFEFIDSLNKFAKKENLKPLPGIQALINELE